jgi:hypothetical protein
MLISALGGDTCCSKKLTHGIQCCHFHYCRPHISYIIDVRNPTILLWKQYISPQSYFKSQYVAHQGAHYKRL